jgi:hypothetical protein
MNDQAALNIVMHRKLCEHEAGHATAALIGALTSERCGQSSRT